MDQTKYINAYVDVAMGTINEYTSQIIQLKTQNRVITESLSEKDNIIVTLTNENESLKNTTYDLSSIRSKNEELVQQNTGMLNKISHMETLMKQVVDMKQEIINRDASINQLNETLGQKDRTIDEMKQEIINRDASTNQLNETLGQKDRTIEKLPEIPIVSTQNKKNVKSVEKLVKVSKEKVFDDF